MPNPQTHQPTAQEQQSALLQRAFAGEDMRDEIILSLQSRIEGLAQNAYRRFSWNGKHGNVIEVSDLVNSANVALLEYYPVAITKENPLGYLFKVAQVVMINYLSGRTGQAINTRAPGGPPRVLSLDMPMENGYTLADRLAYEQPLPESASTCQRDEMLHQAIDCLPEKQRTVIQRYFGLNEHAPTSLYQLSKELSDNPHSRTAYHHFHCGVVRLSQSYTGGIK